MIKSDALGKLGEQKFGSWCAEADLTFNKSEWDRAGWDFILDFDMTPAQGMTLDQRPGAHACRIQVKTVGHNKKAVRLRLDMAERLAKDPGPSFVVGLRMDETHQVVALHVLPMLDDRLAAILKRLREASLKDGGPLSKKKITLPLTPATQIDISGCAMKSKFLEHVGPDLHTYIQRKQAQLKTLGFEERPIGSTFTLAPELQADFEKMFLGHEGHVAVSGMEVTETRFGLSKVTSAAQPAVISLKAHPFDACTVTVRPQAGPPLVFSGDFYLMPPGFEQKMRVQLKLFDLVRTAANPHQLNLFFDLSNKRAWPNEWLTFWSAIKAFTQRETLIEVVGRTKPINDELRPVGLAEGFDTAAVERACATSAMLDRIAQRAAWPTTAELSWQHIQAYARWFDLIDKLVSGKLTSRVYSVKSNVKPTSSDSRPAAFICHVPMGDHILVCGATADISYKSLDGRLECTLKHIHVKQSAVVASDRGLDSFVERLKRRENLTDQFIFGESAESPPQPGD
ncbi:MAG: hypothetical protein WA777_20735 [Rhodanobacter sp.]